MSDRRGRPVGGCLKIPLFTPRPMTKTYRGPIDKLRRAIKHRSTPVFVYFSRRTNSLLASSCELESDFLELVGVYERSVPTAQLKEDIAACET